MVQQGVKIATLNIGGMAWRPGKKVNQSGVIRRSGY